MTDYNPTEANVVWNSGKRPVLGIAGATVVEAQVVYLDTSDGEWKLYQATVNPASKEIALALSNGYDGRHVILGKKGANVNLGFTTTAGTPIVASANAAGALAPEADLGSGEYYVLIGIGNGTASVELLLEVGTAVHA